MIKNAYPRWHATLKFGRASSKQPATLDQNIALSAPVSENSSEVMYKPMRLGNNKSKVGATCVHARMLASAEVWDWPMSRNLRGEEDVVGRLEYA